MAGFPDMLLCFHPHLGTNARQFTPKYQNFVKWRVDFGDL